MEDRVFVAKYLSNVILILGGILVFSMILLVTHGGNLNFYGWQLNEQQTDIYIIGGFIGAGICFVWTWAVKNIEVKKID